MLVQAVGHGDRQMLRPADRHGNPRGRGYRDYCALSKQQQGYTTCPGHRDRWKRVNGVASGDLVRFRHKTHGMVEGYAVLMKKRARVSVMRDGKQVSVKAAAATLLARNHGYRITTEANN